MYTTTHIHSTTEGWRRHKSLWRVDKPTTISTWINTHPTLEQWEARIQPYYNTLYDVPRAAADTRIGFVAVECGALRGALHTEAQAWVMGLVAAAREQHAGEVQRICIHGEGRGEVKVLMQLLEASRYDKRGAAEKICMCGKHKKQHSFALVFWSV